MLVWQGRDAAAGGGTVVVPSRAAAASPPPAGGEESAWPWAPLYPGAQLPPPVQEAQAQGHYGVGNFKLSSFYTWDSLIS